MIDHNTDETVSRRSVLKTTGGLLGTAVLAGGWSGLGSAETEEGLHIDVRELTEEVMAVKVWIPDETHAEDIADIAILGHADQFVVHEEEDTVSLPENTDGLATPAEMDFENPHEAMIYFRTTEIDLSEAGDEEVMLGLGLFSERTIPKHIWDACPGHRDY